METFLSSTHMFKSEAWSFWQKVCCVVVDVHVNVCWEIKKKKNQLENLLSANSQANLILQV